MTNSADNAPRKSRLKGVLWTLVKVVIAIAGLCYVLTKPSFSVPIAGERYFNISQLYVSPAFHWDDTAVIPRDSRFKTITFQQDTLVHIVSPTGGGGGERERGVTAPSGEVRIRFPDTAIPVRLGDLFTRVVIAEDSPVSQTGEKLGIPHEVDYPVDNFKTVGNEAITPGVRKILADASDHWYLLAIAWGILIVPFLVTAKRWQALMRPQGIEIPFSKSLQITFVGQFYSIFLPGITGGDLFKIVYAARLTGSKTKSLVTVVLDRVIGLVALMVIGGISAGLQLYRNAHAANPAAGDDSTLKKVFLLIVLGLAAVALGCLVYFSRRLRAATGLQKLIDHPRMPYFVKHADEVLHHYRGHFGLLAWAFGISLFSQLTLPISAWLSGMAFGIDMNVGYYLAYIPVAILAASLPISPPQGVGVLDWIIMHLFVARGAAKAGQAFALTQAVRFLPVLWNLVGSYWMITGKFSRHQAMEEEKAIKDQEEKPEARSQ